MLGSLECIGEALLGAGDVDAARKELERAMALLQGQEKGPQWTARPRFLLARALWATPGERPRARELAGAALQELVAAEGDNRALIAEIRAWLSTRDQPPARRRDAPASAAPAGGR